MRRVELEEFAGDAALPHAVVAADARVDPRYGAGHLPVLLIVEPGLVERFGGDGNLSFATTFMLEPAGRPSRPRNLAESASAVDSVRRKKTPTG